MAHLKALQQPFNMARPQTSGAAFGRKAGEDLFALEETTTDDFDKELNEMILQNQKRLAELQSDIKEVNKIAGEPVVNIRKIKQVRAGGAGKTASAQKSLNIKSMSKQHMVGDEVIEDA